MGLMNRIVQPMERPAVSSQHCRRRRTNRPLPGVGRSARIGGAECPRSAVTVGEEGKTFLFIDILTNLSRPQAKKANYSLLKIFNPFHGDSEMDQQDDSRVRLLNEQDASQMLGIAVRTLQSWRVQRKGIPYLKLGGAVRYRVGDIKEWLERSLVTPRGEIR
jgi:predicted DNA-binding transcriptional regulator AlpA